MTSMSTFMIVVMVGSAIINALLSCTTIMSGKLLHETPEIDRGALSKSPPKSEKYSWSGPQESSRLAVIVVWIFFFIGLMVVVLGLLFMTDRWQEFFFAIGMSASIFSLYANFTASFFTLLVMKKMQEEKKKLEDPMGEEERGKKRKKFFGISINII